MRRPGVDVPGRAGLLGGAPGGARGPTRSSAALRVRRRVPAARVPNRRPAPAGGHVGRATQRKPRDAALAAVGRLCVLRRRHLHRVGARQRHRRRAHGRRLRVRRAQAAAAGACRARVRERQRGWQAAHRARCPADAQTQAARRRCPPLLQRPAQRTRYL